MWLLPLDWSKVHILKGFLSLMPPYGGFIEHEAKIKTSVNYV